MPQKRHSSHVVHGDPPPHTAGDNNSKRRKHDKPSMSDAQTADVINLEDGDSNVSHSNRRLSLVTLDNATVMNQKQDGISLARNYAKPGRDRHNRNRPHKTTEGVRGGSGQFEKSYLDPNGDMEDPHDRISEDELSQPTKSQTRPFVEITSGGYTGSANPRPSRQLKNIMGSFGKKPAGRETETQSRFFLGSRDISGQKSTKSRNTNGLYLQGNAFNESVDELSAEHHIAQDETRPSQNRKAHSSILTQNTLEDGENGGAEADIQYQDVGGESTDDDSVVEANIKPSRIETIKRPRRRDGEKQFTVEEVFSDQASWLDVNSHSSCILTCDASRQLTLYDIQGKELWMSFVDILRAESDKADTKLILYMPNPIGGRSSIGQTLYLRFGTVQERAVCEEVILGKESANLLRSKARLDRVFEHQYKQYQKSWGKKPLRSKDADIELYESNQKNRVDQMFDKELSRRNQQSQRGSQAERCETSPQGLAKQMQSLQVQNLTSTSNGQQQPVAKDEVAPDNFYGGKVDNKNQEPTTRARRNAQRQSTYHEPSPEPAPPVERWTDKHPNWADEHDWKQKASLIYPQGGVKKTTVDRQDIERLDEGEFLNDNLIAFYLRYLEKELQEKNPAFAKRVYFQNTFFYDRLVKSPPRGKRINYDAVQRWTAKVDLTNYDYIIVPVNELQHWYVAVIYKAKALLDAPSGVSDFDENVLKDVKEDEEIQEMVAPERNREPSTSVNPRSMRSSPLPSSADQTTHIIDIDEDSEMPVGSDLVTQGVPTRPSKIKKSKRKSVQPVRKYDPEAPRIIILDSLGVKHNLTAMNLRAYLAAELGYRHGIEIDASRAKLHTAQGIPQQDNYCDCGLYILLYIERLLASNGEFVEKILQGTSQENSDWKAAPDLRTHIRDMLFSLQKEQAVFDEEAKQEKIRRKAIEKKMKEGRSSPASGTILHVKAVVEGVQSSPPRAPNRLQQRSPSLDRHTEVNKSFSALLPRVLGYDEERDITQQKDNDIEASRKRPLEYEKQPNLIEIKDSQDQEPSQDKQSPSRSLAESTHQPYPGLKEFGGSFKHKTLPLESSGDAIPGTLASSSVGEMRDIVDVTSSDARVAPQNPKSPNKAKSSALAPERYDSGAGASPVSRRAQRKQTRIREINLVSDSPEQRRRVGDPVQMSTLNGANFTATFGSAPESETTDTDPIDQLATADDQRSDFHIDMQSADNAERLLRDDPAPEMKHRRLPKSLSDQVEAGKKRIFVDLEEDEEKGSSRGKKSKNAWSEHGQQRSPVRSSQKPLNSPTRSRRSKHDFESGKAVFSNNLEEVMMESYTQEHKGNKKTIHIPKVVSRLHQRFNDNGEPIKVENAA